ncbi:glycoside hydrolase family 2 TIM barrel-domain containing protein [Paenibacillus sp. Aloe-11]|uniref:glycoside hydrolase family 2 TIM barrel-domain containing protein n=1 Tax=Paenibacillus sp. Aloe-11 TaxID=1050222 RepID=UPI00024F0663|nr:glycoside hydrolase family 2 TIM barrel-domain containing protein [Paenibacillus sp. Aloe-11]EHS57611.1 glycoside hydrolase family protein [Paenibacillus sp. Aloe-11]
MIRTSFNGNWTVGSKTGFFSEKAAAKIPSKTVTLPHDAMIERNRKKPIEGGSGKSDFQIAFYPEGEYEYRKMFFVPEKYKDKRVTIEFEGVYMNAMVYLNGAFAGHQPNGYTNFYIKADRFLKYGEENEIKVISMNYKDSRWYSGAGIYRNTNLLIGNLVHIALDGVKISTPDIDADRAVVHVATVLENEGLHTHTVDVRTEIVDADGSIVGSDFATLTTIAGEGATLRQRVYIRQPKLWSVENPHLYTCRTRVMTENEQLDEETNSFGIRSLTLDPDRGLCINGEVVKLRGACIHHDNGVLGAATIDRAEERRVEILKQAGFNALRSAHHPMSKALLDACDRLGMLVMDESFDMWTSTKVDHDYALHFPVWWEKDIQAMIDKDYNHPCVILYSIGNEIPEAGRPIASVWGHRLAEKIRSLDSTRFVTNSINFIISVWDELVKIRSANQAASNEGINTMMNNMGQEEAAIIKSDLATHRTAESFGYVDIAGYNYAEARYQMDRELFPNRVIVGSETFPQMIDKNWKQVLENSHIIGDFTWTGWDYLGEVGVGRVKYDPNEVSFLGSYPWLTAWCGDIDIIGNRRPVSYYREIVFGLRKDPYIAVQRPDHYGKQPIPTKWSWSDSVSSWSWNGYEGGPIRVEVYADADEVELLVNGKSAGKAAAGYDQRYKAEFDVVYEPGEIAAVAYTDGQATGRMMLHSATSDVQLKVEADRSEISASDGDLSFVMISLVDGRGNLYNTADRKVAVQVKGSGVLQGFGSADPKSSENFFDTERTTFDGKALAVVRPKDVGIITVTVTAEGCGQKIIQINAIANTKTDTPQKTTVF